MPTLITHLIPESFEAETPILFFPSSSLKISTKSLFITLSFMGCKHHLEMYQLLVEKCPETLVIKDNWEDTPMFFTHFGVMPQKRSLNSSSKLHVAISGVSVWPGRHHVVLADKDTLAPTTHSDLTGHDREKHT
jgi:hypothetical protein